MITTVNSNGQYGVPTNRLILPTMFLWNFKNEVYVSLKWINQAINHINWRIIFQVREGRFSQKASDAIIKAPG